MAYEQQIIRDEMTRRARRSRQHGRAAEVGAQDTPKGRILRSNGRFTDQTDQAIEGFMMTGGESGGFMTNPGGTLG